MKQPGILIIISLCILSCNAPETTKKSSTTAQSKSSDTLVSVRNRDLDTVATSIKDTQPLQNTTKAPSNIYLIVPGKMIGSVYINEPAPDVYRVLGAAQEGDAAMGKSIQTYISKSNPMHKTTLYTSISQGNEAFHRVKQIRVNSPSFKTATGIGVGATKQDILKQFPNLKTAGNYRNTQLNTIIFYEIDKTKGICFEFDTDETCTGVTVLEPGHELFGYLAFFPDAAITR